MHDDELTLAATGGDRAAFAALVDRHRPMALRVAYAIANGEAEDATQEAAAKALRQFDRFDAGRSFKPWFLAIVANEARNRRRSFLRRNALVLRVAQRPTDVDEDAADTAARSQRRQDLLDAVAKLSDADRQIIAMRYFAELSEAEVAAALDIAPGTVKSRTSRALSRLRTELGPEMETVES